MTTAPAPIKKKYGFIDSFRGIAVLLVLFTHSTYVFDPSSANANPSFIFLVHMGARGVQLFYMVSAFTIFNSYYIRQQKGDNSTISFYLRRFFRIAPLFYICLAALLIDISGHYFENFQFFSPRIADNVIHFHIQNVGLYFLSTFAFINGLIPKYLQSPYPGGWSIAVEFSFYMLVPLLFKIVKNLTSALWLTIITSIVCFTIELYTLKNPDKLVITEFLWFSLIYQFYFFALGITAFFYFKAEHKAAKINYWQIAFVILLPFALLKNGLSMFIGIIFFALVISSVKKMWLLDNKVLQYIGRVSFSIYLTQWWIIIGLSKITQLNQMHWFIVFLINVSLNVLLSTFTYQFIEKKFVRLGEVFIKKFVIKPKEIKN